MSLLTSSVFALACLVTTTVTADTPSTSVMVLAFFEAFLHRRHVAKPNVAARRSGNHELRQFRRIGHHSVSGGRSPLPYRARSSNPAGSCTCSFRSACWTVFSPTPLDLSRLEVDLHMHLGFGRPKQLYSTDYSRYGLESSLYRVSGDLAQLRQRLGAETAPLEITGMMPEIELEDRRRLGFLGELAPDRVNGPLDVNRREGGVCCRGELHVHRRYPLARCREDRVHVRSPATASSIGLVISVSMVAGSAPGSTVATTTWES